LASGVTVPFIDWTGAALPAGTAITPATFHLVNGLAHGFFTVDNSADTVSFTETMVGDANQDGHVDLGDLSTVLNNFGKTTSLWTDGNFDGSTTVDLTDLSNVLNNFGAVVQPQPLSVTASTAAPEAASLLLLTPLLLTLPKRRRPSHP